MHKKDPDSGVESVAVLITRVKSACALVFLPLVNSTAATFTAVDDVYLVTYLISECGFNLGRRTTHKPLWNPTLPDGLFRQFTVLTFYKRRQSVAFEDTRRVNKQWYMRDL